MSLFEQPKLRSPLTTDKSLAAELNQSLRRLNCLTMPSNSNRFKSIMKWLERQYGREKVSQAISWMERNPTKLPKINNAYHFANHFPTIEFHLRLEETSRHPSKNAVTVSGLVKSEWPLDPKSLLGVAELSIKSCHALFDAAKAVKDSEEVRNRQPRLRRFIEFLEFNLFNASYLTKEWLFSLCETQPQPTSVYPGMVLDYSSWRFEKIIQQPVIDWCHGMYLWSLLKSFLLGDRK